MSTVLPPRYVPGGVTVLFTTTDKLLSRMIRYLTGEPVSHCALLVEGIILEATVTGIQVVSMEDFLSRNKIVYSLTIPGHSMSLYYKYSQYRNSIYDYGSIAYLGLRYFVRKYLMLQLPKANLWASTGMYTCTELVTSALSGKEDSEITPYKLYRRLQNEWLVPE